MAQELGHVIRSCLDAPEEKQVEDDTSAVTSESEAPTQVMIVDDDQLVRQAMSRLLRSLGYSPIAVASTAEAIDCLVGEPVGAILIDQHLDGEDGFKSAPLLRKQARQRESPRPPLVIGMTGSVQSADSGAEGLDGCLVKPFSADQLRQFLEHGRS